MTNDERLRALTDLVNAIENNTSYAAPHLIDARAALHAFKALYEDMCERYNGIPRGSVMLNQRRIDTDTNDP